MIDAWGPIGTFLFYASVTIFGFFFILVFVKETSGLTDKQKKQLYWPKKTENK
jgi:hypothetical protein